MLTDTISYQNSGYFSSLLKDYLDQKKNIAPLYHRFPSLENFEPQIQEKKQNFNSIDPKKRETLVKVLKTQYANIQVSESTLSNISLLEKSNTFTITTGHQLNLFSGPLYFLYKIISTINLTQDLKLKYPEYDFVPVYWMATEDHDIEEINYFNFKNNKLKWNAKCSGPVGRMTTEGLTDFFNLYQKELGTSKNAEYLKKLFQESYLQHHTLAEATRFLANELFGSFGLIILDADHLELKQSFIPYLKNELLQKTAYSKVLETNQNLKEYAIQVNPREINLFYMDNNIRERIVEENQIYKVNNTSIVFSEKQILELVEKNPEKFSPNVIMRPLYQETILPNLCYIGGGGEIAYWLQLKSFFDHQKITFPILLVRNSVVLTNKKQMNKANKLDLSWSDLFMEQSNLINKKTKEMDDYSIDLSLAKETLKKQFEDLYILAKKTDKSFEGAVKAQEKKQLKGLENLEKRLLKAQKIKHSDILNRIINLQNELFPKQSLQERQNNFSEFYLDYGQNFMNQLFENLKPLKNNFNTIELE